MNIQEWIVKYGFKKAICCFTCKHHRFSGCNYHCGLLEGIEDLEINVIYSGLKATIIDSIENGYFICERFKRK